MHKNIYVVYFSCEPKKNVHKGYKNVAERFFYTDEETARKAAESKCRQAKQWVGDEMMYEIKQYVLSL